ncbi:MAG: ferrous iron transport protein A [Anaerolineae bacterium]|nr:ferrous iron transport protein A [Anaerolineae bacterium]
MVPLGELSPGETGLVYVMRGGRGFIARLAALGFTPGAPVKVIRNYGFGPLIVALRGTQVALGRREAQHIWVHNAEDKDDTVSAK